MRVELFEWDTGNIEKCQKHGVTLEEIESVFDRPFLFLRDPSPQREQRFRGIGTTVQGRKAFVVFTVRGISLRPLSARYMHKREVERYEQAYPDIPF